MLPNKVSKLFGLLQDMLSDKRAQMKGGSGGGKGGMMGGGGGAQKTLEAAKQELNTVQYALKDQRTNLGMAEQNVNSAQSPELKQESEAEVAKIKEMIGSLEQKESALRQEINSLRKAAAEEKVAQGLKGKGPYGQMASMAIGQKAAKETASAEKTSQAKVQTAEKNMQKAASKPAPSGGGGGKSEIKIKGSNLMPGATDAVSGGGGGSGTGDVAAAMQTWKYVVIILLVGLAGWLKYAAENVPVYAYLPFVFFIILLVLSTIWHGRLAFVVMILLLVATVYTAVTFTGPYAVQAVASGQAQESAAEGAQKTTTGLRAFIENTKKSWDKNMKIASGEHLEGEVEKTTVQPPGIELLDTYYQRYDLKKIKITELDLFELNARLKAFDPKTDIVVRMACHVKESSVRSAATQSTVGGKIDRYPGEEQDSVIPKLITVRAGKVYENEVTCEPKTALHDTSLIPSTNITGGAGASPSATDNPITCGRYIGTLTAQVDDLRTDGRLENYIMFEDSIYEEMQQTVTYEEKNTELERVMRALHPELESYKSVSEEGPIKILIDTERNLVIGVSEDRPLTLKFGLENTLDGWLRELNSVKIVLPPEVEPVSGRCKGWEMQGENLVPTEKALTTINFDDTGKGAQKLFPSCRLRVKNAAEFVQPEHITFLASVDYDYMVQKRFDFTVVNETGGNTC